MQLAFALTVQHHFHALPFWGVGLGLVLFVNGFRQLRRRRLILNTPQSPIRSAALGLVEVFGTATGPYTITAPITRNKCYYYRTVLWKWKKSTNNDGGSWEKVADERLYVPFYVEDKTGKILVDPAGADLDLHCDFKGEFHESLFQTRDATPENVAPFLAIHGLGLHERVKVEEYCIKPHNALFILGTVAENHDCRMTAVPTIDPVRSMNNRGSFATVAAVARALPQAFPSTSTAVAIAQAMPGVSPSVLKTGLTQPSQPVTSSQPSTAVLIAEPPASNDSGAEIAKQAETSRMETVVLKKGLNQKDFYISWRSRNAVVGSLATTSLLMIWCGPMITVVCLFFVLHQLGVIK